MKKACSVSRVPYWAVGVMLAGWCWSAASWGFTNRVSATTSGGGWMTNSYGRSYAVLGAAAGVTRLGGTSLIAHTGLANTFLLAPQIDTNTNGIPDENDPDNESDGLTDLEELTGAEFSPATMTDPLESDSDGDGIGDFAESVAGTNPMDADSYLHLTYLVQGDNEAVFGWVGRQHYTYDILAASNAQSLADAPEILEQVTGGHGSGPWQVAYMIYSNAYQPGACYGVRVTGTP